MQKVMSGEKKQDRTNANVANVVLHWRLLYAMVLSPM